MKAWIPLTLVFAVGSAAHSQATCAYPHAPVPPDGATATNDRMVSAKHDFEQYNREMNAYLDCIKLEIDVSVPKDMSKFAASDKKKAEERQKILTQKNNAAIDELEANVGHFNDQLKIYKATHGKY